MVNEQFHVVFLDEFLVNRETTSAYGWARKGQPGRLLMKSLGFKASFIVAFSLSRVEGLKGTTTTLNQIKFATFLRSLIAKLKNNSIINDRKIVIVADNYRFHRSKNIKKIFEKERLA